MQTTFGRMVRLGFVTMALLGRAPVALSQEPRVITIAAQRFAFSPSEVRLKKGEPVTLRVSSADVTHGLYMKALGIDADIAPGKTTDAEQTSRDG